MRVSSPALRSAASEALRRALQTQSASLRICVKEIMTRAAPGRFPYSRQREFHACSPWHR
jgi:hypothetical protein